MIYASVTPQISAGEEHTLALKSDGTVWAWGSNDNGKLGDGTYTYRITPVQVGSLSDITAIACGGVWETKGFSIALKSDGTVWAWGGNDNGQLGDGTTIGKANPVQVNGLSGVIAIAGGGSHAVALKSDGTVWTWGYNLDGELGDGTKTNRTTPVQVSELSNIIAIACGGYHTVALKSDGTIWTWGYNGYGQLGDGTTTDRTVPVKVSGLDNVTIISSGSWHTLAIRSDGMVWAWGWGQYGQLGDGTTTDKKATIGQVSGLSEIIAISGGGRFSAALKSNETVWSWGFNEQGELGDGTNTDKNLPVQIGSLSGIAAIAAGEWHVVALKSDGTVWAWGENGAGQLGDGTKNQRNTPVQVGNLNLGQTTASMPTPTVTASPTPSPSPTPNDSSEVLIFSDDFERSDYSDKWKSGAGRGGNKNTITIVDGYIESTTNGNYIETLDSFTGNLRIEVDVMMVGNMIVPCWDFIVTLVSPNVSGIIRFDYDEVDGINISTYNDECGDKYTMNSSGANKGKAVLTYSGFRASFSFTNNNGDVLKTDEISASSVKSKVRIVLAGHQDSPRYIDNVKIYSLGSTTASTPTPTHSPTPKATPTPFHETGSGVIYGFVADVEGFALKKVSVTLTDSSNYSRNTTTDTEGYYEFTSLAADDYTITYEKDGYQTQTKT